MKRETIFDQARQFIGVDPELHNRRSEFIDNCESNLQNLEVEEAIEAWKLHRASAGRKLI